MSFVGKEEPNQLNDRLQQLHEEIKVWCPCINRISVALFDVKTNILKTFINSSDDGSPLDHYEADLDSVESLRKLSVSRCSRTVNDLSIFKTQKSEHSRKIIEQGYMSSHTVPIIHNDEFHGFIFFNASETGYFTDVTVTKLDVYAQLVGLLCVTEFMAIRTLQAAVKSAREITSYRDEETGTHLSRMSNFSRLIALSLAKTHDLTDEYIEYIYNFAPLHDIGKISIPDNILLKEGALNDEERQVMQSHVTLGVKIVDKMISGFHMENLPRIEMLKNVVLCHHEAMDGTGYPRGVSGDQIPLEARIVSVADVFDALTSARPYKKAWSNAEAFKYLDENSPHIFDEKCVEALKSQVQKIEKIQNKFHEDMFG